MYLCSTCDVSFQTAAQPYIRISINKNFQIKLIQYFFVVKCQYAFENEYVGT